MKVLERGEEAIATQKYIDDSDGGSDCRYEWEREWRSSSDTVAQSGTRIGTEKPELACRRQTR